MTKTTAVYVVAHRPEPVVTSVDRTMPADGGPASPGRTSVWWILRLGVHLAVAGIPLLAISADVLGLVPLQTVAVWVLLPVLAVLATVVFADPHPSDRVVLIGLLCGRSCSTRSAIASRSVSSRSRPTKVAARARSWTIASSRRTHRATALPADRARPIRAARSAS